MKLIKLFTVSSFMLFAAPVFAESAVIEYFDSSTSCFNEFGELLSGQSQTVRQVVITNDGEGTVNVSVKGVCYTSSDSAVNLNNFDFDELGCNAGSAGIVFFWKYHMRPDGKYHLTCSSNSLDT